jgi:glycosyltransferase involved in cell wall biosynthesis
MKRSFELIFVDDGSTDGSFKVLENIHAKDPRVKVIRFRRNFGKAAALSAGFGLAEGSVVVTMDADLQDVPSEIPKLLTKLDEGFDLVSGWKKDRKDSFSRVFGSKLFNWLVRDLTGIRLHDVNCGFKSYRSEVVKSLSLYGEMHRFIPVLAADTGFSVGEVVVEHKPRKHGASRYGGGRIFKGLLDLLTVLFITRYLSRPAHLFGTMGAAIFMVGFGICSYITYLRLTYGTILQRYPLLFLGVLCIIVGVQFVSTGLLGEMIFRLRTDRAGTYSVRDQLK